jgi:hypothetical protein
VSRSAALLLGLIVLERINMMLGTLDPAIGLYLHVAASWFDGHLPYVAAWEYKPPGLFALYALALRIVPFPVLAVQVLAIAASFATALIVMRLGTAADSRGRTSTGLLAALFFVMLSIEDEGYNGDAEVLMTPFLAGAMWVALEAPSSLRFALAVGVLLGAALQTKLSAIPMLLPPIAVLLARTRHRVRDVFACVAAIVAPFVLEAIVYAANNSFAAFFDANVGATMRRATGLRSGLLVNNLGVIPEHLRILAPPLELAPFALLHPTRRVVAYVGWFAAAAFSIAAAGEYYAHQFVVLHAPVALLGALGLRFALDKFVRKARTARVVAVLALVLTFGLHDYYQVIHAGRVVVARQAGKPTSTGADEPAVLRAIQATGLAKDGVFVVQQDPYIYDELGVAAPTRFAYTDHLLDDRMTGMAGIDGRREINRILDTRPAIVSIGDLDAPQLDRSLVALVRARLRRDYVAQPRDKAGVVLYRLRSYNLPRRSST